MIADWSADGVVDKTYPAAVVPATRGPLVRVGVIAALAALGTGVLIPVRRTRARRTVRRSA